MWSKIKIISLIGYSGSGKTLFITKAIKLLKLYLNYEVAVIKNVHEHQIDEKGKDSFIYSEAGAIYSVIKNLNNESAIFLRKKFNMEELIDWLSKGPLKIDLIFTEGFRTFEGPTVICLKNSKELKPQYNDNIKMISGLICLKKIKEIKGFEIPIIDIQTDFDKFLEIFEISKIFKNK